MTVKICHEFLESWVGGPVSFHRCFLSEQGKLRNSFVTIGTQRTCDVFRFVRSVCKGWGGEMCMCEIHVGVFFHVATSRIRAPRPF